ncbi:MAG TPA: carboxymuconolactone decarboxylase family protein [Candidatus Binataceae bacterium]|jgi:alkylhydroperoxidase family enzyme|nr:carboxymuconolactone decarboxylase family protein [Candidatus Binataceae bacterium]
MARLPYLNREDLDPDERFVFDEFERERGTPPANIHRLMANAPNLMRRFSTLAVELRNHTRLDPRLRELALMTVGRIAGAEYEFVHHWNIALRVGVRREQLEQLVDFERSPVFDEQERAVMRYAAEVTSNIKVSDATFDALRAFLDHRRLMELAMNVATYNAVVRIIVPLGVELEPDAKKN